MLIAPKPSAGIAWGLSIGAAALVPRWLSPVRGEPFIVVRARGFNYTGPAVWHPWLRRGHASWTCPLALPGRQIGIKVNGSEVRAIVLPDASTLDVLTKKLLPDHPEFHAQFAQGMRDTRCVRGRRDNAKVHRQIVRALGEIREEFPNAEAFARFGPAAARKEDAVRLGKRERAECRRLAKQNRYESVASEDCRRCGSHRCRGCADALAGGWAGNIREQIDHDIVAGHGGDYLFVVLTVDQTALAKAGHNAATAAAVYSDGQRGPWRKLTQRIERMLVRANQGALKDAQRALNDGDPEWERLPIPHADFEYVRVLEQHKNGWPHWALVVRSRGLADLLRADPSWSKRLVAMAQACGYGRCQFELVRDLNAIPSEVAKVRQHPESMPRGVHRFQASRAFFSGVSERMDPEDKMASEAPPPPAPKGEACLDTIIALSTGLSKDALATPVYVEDGDRQRVNATVIGRPPTCSEIADLGDAEDAIESFLERLSKADERVQPPPVAEAEGSVCPAPPHLVVISQPPDEADPHRQPWRQHADHLPVPGLPRDHAGREVLRCA